MNRQPKKEISKKGHDMNARMKKARETLGISQVKFGEAAGIGVGTIKNIDCDRTEPNMLFFDLLCKAHNINFEWVETGEGDMFCDLSREEKIAKFIGEALSEEDSFKHHLIRILSELDETGWKKLDEAAHALLDAQEQCKSDNS